MNVEFRRVLGAEPQAQGAAPGRVNLIGDHTDYAEGFCLPMPLAHVTQVAMARAVALLPVSLTTSKMLAFDSQGYPACDLTGYTAAPIARQKAVKGERGQASL